MTFADGLKITDVTTVVANTSQSVVTVAVGSIARMQVRFSDSSNDRTMNLKLNGTTINSITPGVKNILPFNDFLYLDESDVVITDNASGGSGSVEYNIYIETFNKP